MGLGRTRKFEHLLESGRIGKLELKNRIVMPPMVTVLGGLWGEVTNEQISWYARRAKGGAGLIVVECCFTATSVDNVKPPGIRLLRADDDCYIPGLACLADAVHESDGKIGIQLSPGAGAQAVGVPWTFRLEGVQSLKPVSPSGVPAYGVALHGTVKQPRELTIEEIERIIELYGEAARRVKQAGFDLIEMHGHEGYLMAEFLSPYFNKRTDKYGGSLDNRLRFMMELIGSVRKAVGPDSPIIMKYSIDEFIEGGLEIKESQLIAKKLEEAGINGISCSYGVYGSKMPTIPPYNVPRGNLVYLSEAIKASVNIPTLTLGRLDDPELAEQILKDGKADFIGIGRGLIADPDWPQKVADGRIEEIRKCIACNECRVSIHTQHPIRCALNAAAGRETQYDSIKPCEAKKKVVIVGGGPGGMEAARVSALKGHQVILFEANGGLGGTLKLAAIPPHKEIMMSIPEYYSREFSKLGVELRLGKRATAALVLKEKPDIVIISTGGLPLIPEIPGVEKSNVVTALDVLSGKVKTGKEVIVAGGGTVGCEVANFLAQQNKKVTIVEMLEAIGIDMDSYTLRVLNGELAEKDAEILTSMKIDEITDEGVILIDKNSNKTLCKADTVVLALGLRQLDDLAKELNGKVKKVYTIGDAKLPRKIKEAISEGFVTAYNL